MTSGRVTDGFCSTNFHYFAKPGDQKLNKVFENALNCGVTRFEFSLYTSRFPKYEQLREYQQSKLDSITKNVPFTALPLTDQWD